MNKDEALEIIYDISDEVEASFGRADEVVGNAAADIREELQEVVNISTNDVLTMTDRLRFSMNTTPFRGRNKAKIEASIKQAQKAKVRYFSLLDRIEFDGDDI